MKKTAKEPIDSDGQNVTRTLIESSEETGDTEHSNDMSDNDSDGNDDENLLSTAQYDPKMCSICLDVFEVGDAICQSQNKECPHIFHLDCMMDWLIKHSNCPLCRKEYICDPNGSADNRRRGRRRRRRRRLEEYDTQEGADVNNSANNGASSSARVMMMPSTLLPASETTNQFSSGDGQVDEELGQSSKINKREKG